MSLKIFTLTLPLLFTTAAHAVKDGESYHEAVEIVSIRCTGWRAPRVILKKEFELEEQRHYFENEDECRKAKLEFLRTREQGGECDLVQAEFYPNSGLLNEYGLNAFKPLERACLDD